VTRSPRLVEDSVGDYVGFSFGLANLTQPVE